MKPVRGREENALVYIVPADARAATCGCTSIARELRSPWRWGCGKISECLKEKPYCPPPVLNSEYPDGVPDLPPTLARELHNAKLIAFRVTALAQKIRDSTVDGSSSSVHRARGDKQRLGLYDLAFDLHSSVMGLPFSH
mmetsp:Transcript_19944/g.53769  ORF Transcript_19944/g.53769 Transcript_19944/m.53769 type:complete len:139 (+) Transcript_19944:66-482(+)